MLGLQSNGLDGFGMYEKVNGLFTAFGFAAFQQDIAIYFENSCIGRCIQVKIEIQALNTLHLAIGILPSQQIVATCHVHLESLSVLVTGNWLSWFLAIMIFADAVAIGAAIVISGHFVLVIELFRCKWTSRGSTRQYIKQSRKCTWPLVSGVAGEGTWNGERKTKSRRSSQDDMVAEKVLA